MEKKKDSPQKAALREMMGNYLKENNVSKRQIIMRLDTRLLQPFASWSNSL